MTIQDISHQASKESPQPARGSSRSASPNQRPWNLLICGPIQHGGLTLSQHVQGGLLRKQDFDCTSTILRNINRWGHLFNEVKLVTWTNQADLIGNELRRTDIDIHLLNDPGRTASFCGDSRIRVMTATAEGLRNTKNKETFTLRIRSDQSFNLEAMIRSHLKAETLIRRHQTSRELDLPHISAPCFWLDRPYALCNYAHAAKTEDLLHFAEAQIRYRHASALAANGWPEGDTVRKHLYSLRQQLQQAGFSSSECFPALPKSLTESPEAKQLSNVPRSVLRLWHFAMKNIYSVSSKKGIKTLFWKGEKYPLPEIFGNGIRFYKDWRDIAIKGPSSILDYCSNVFDLNDDAIDSFEHAHWLMNDRAKLIEGDTNDALEHH
jgi:hypothetical protein